MKFLYARTHSGRRLHKCCVMESVRLPGAANVSFRDKSPVFYTAMTKMHIGGSNREIVNKKNQAMDERFTIRTWTRPLPFAHRQPDFPKCARCFASFMLDNDAAWHRRTAGTWL